MQILFGMACPIFAIDRPLFTRFVSSLETRILMINIGGCDAMRDVSSVIERQQFFVSEEFSGLQ